MKHFIVLLFLLSVSCKTATTNDVVKAANAIPGNDTDTITKNDTVSVPDSIKVIITYPAEKEIDSLKHIWGENQFYLSADGENGYMTNIYDKLKKENIPYITTNNKYLKIGSSLIINKADFGNPWGVVVLDKDKKDYQFYKTTDYIGNNEDANIFKPRGGGFIYEIKISPVETDESNNKKNFEIKIINSTSDKIVQTIKYTPEYLFANDSFNDYANYFDNIDKINEGLENYHDFIIADFNFDKRVDFAILNYEGSNAGPQYTYFIQKNDSFYLDEYLTQEVRFFPDKIDKASRSLTTEHPQGCCKIIKSVYQLSPKEQWENTGSTISEM